MNLALLGGPLAQAIGWALLHLIWQGTVVAALLAVLLPRLSGRSASLRYAVSCACLALIVALGFATAVRSYPGEPAPTTTLAPRSTAASVMTEVPLPSLVLTAVIRTPPNSLRTVFRSANDLLPVIVTVWLVCVAALSLRLILEWLRVRRLVTRDTWPARDSLQAVARRLGLALGVRHVVRLLESAAVEVPSVIGLVRPAILLPASTLTGLTPVQLEMILAHELAHIRRHDFLVNLLQTVVETLLFYHPAVWWISRQVRIERENCCDDLAVELCGSPVRYARALARLEELRPTRSSLAVSASGGSLFDRVRRLVSGSRQSPGPAVRGVSAVAVLSCVLVGLAAQSFTAIGAPKRLPEYPTVRAELMSAMPSDASEAPQAAATRESSTRASDRAKEQADPTAVEDPLAPVAAEKKSATAQEKPKVGDEARPTLEELIALRTQNVTPEMVREMRALFPDVDYMQIASMSAVGASPEYVRGMRHLGLELQSADDAQSLAAVGVTREYVRAMRGVGFPMRSAGEAQGLRAVGVTPEYVRSMRAAGFPMRSPDEAQGLYAVGVTPEYVRGMRDAGVVVDDVGELQSLRALGITPEFVRVLAKAGYPNPTMDQLQRLGAAGLTGDFVREMSRYRTP